MNTDTWPSPEMDMTGKVAIVAGGGAIGDGIGNGRAVSILLARAGAKVMVVDADQDRAQATVDMIEGCGGTATARSADLTDEAQCKALVADAVSTFGRLDYLDNNIGISSRRSVVDEDIETWRKLMQVNVEAAIFMSKHAIPAMIDSGGGGAIVNISSISALRPRGLTAYSTTKGAVIALTRAMAVDHGPDGIRVNCVAPGPVYTPMVYTRGMEPAQRAQRSKASVLGIEGEGWDVGFAVRFLLSDHARYITGQTLVVDGGVTLQAPARSIEGQS